MNKEQLFTVLSDEQAEKVVGGVGAGAGPGSSAGFFGWGTSPNMSTGQNGLFRAGFSPMGGELNVNQHSAVPVIVPGPKLI